MKTYPRIVQVNTLSGFQVEIPVPSRLPGSPIEPRDPIVYLNLSEATRSGEGIPQKTIALDLQGVNERDEIVWLHYSQRVYWSQDGPLPGRDASLCAGMSAMRDLAKDHLSNLGYQVRGGRYGIPGDVSPLRGVFECARWEKDGDEYALVMAHDDQVGLN